MSKRKIAFLLVLIAALAAGGWFWTHRTAHEKAVRPAPGPVPVRVVEARTGEVPVYLTGLGNVEPLNTIVVRPQIDGELMQVYFQEGQEVEKGDLLAEIDPRTIKAELARVEAEKNSNKAQLAIAQMDLRRYTALLQDDAIAHQVVDQQKATVQQLEANIQVAQAAVDAANVRLSYTKILSPGSGHVGIRRIDPGNIVSASDTGGLVTITQMDPVAVLFSMPQTNLGDLLPLLKEEDRPVDILPRESGEIIATGRLQTIDNQIDQTTGTVRLKALVDNGGMHLWPGQFVIARIKVKTLADKVVIPSAAIQRGQGNSFVYRIIGEKAESANVTVLYDTSEQAVVEGVAPGDIVVVDGQLRLKPGLKVSIIGDDDAIVPKDP